MAKRLLFVVPVLIFIGVAIQFALGLQRDPRIIPTVLTDKEVPSFDLPPLAGGMKGLKSDDLRQEVSLVNVFASWCGPCRIEHPLLVRLAEQKIVPIYGLNWKDKPQDALQWLKELGDPYARIGSDQNGRTAIDFGVYGAPETFVIDREGRIRHKHVGPITAQVLEQQILPLIEGLKK